MFYTIAADGSKTSTQLHMNELLFRWRGKTWIKYLWSRIISVSWGFVLSKSFISQDDSSCMAHVHRAQLWDRQICLDMGFCTANLRAKAERFTKCKPLEPWKNSTFLICWAKMKQPGCFAPRLSVAYGWSGNPGFQDRRLRLTWLRLIFSPVSIPGIIKKGPSWRLPETNIAPENRPSQKETRKSSNHPFSGANC